MNRKTLLILSFILFLGTIVAGAASRFPFTGETTSDRVNIRAGQNENFETLLKVDKGAALVVQAESYGWYQVRLPERVVVFISAEYVRRAAPDVGEVTADRVNVRARPDTRATILGQVTEGQRFFIIDDKEVPEGWIALKPVEGLCGWVHASLVAFKTDKVLPVSSPQVGLPVRAAGEVPVERPSFVKDLGNGKVACSGKILKVEGAAAPYRLVQGDATACLVNGPAAIVDGFLSRDVEVEGALRAGEDPSGLAVINLSRIKLLL